MDADPIQPGNVAVVTGAASGIGRALATAFADEGMRVVLADNNATELRAAETTLAEAGRDVFPVVCDISSEAEVQSLARLTLERYGAAHVLCNNAGVVGKGDAWRGPFSNWEWVVGINLFGVVHGIRAFLPIMEDQGLGHIVNTASMAGLLAVPGQPPYNATKSAVVAISESLFIELRQSGSPVRVERAVPGVRAHQLDARPALGRSGSARSRRCRRTRPTGRWRSTSKRGSSAASIGADHRRRGDRRDPRRPLLDPHPPRGAPRPGGADAARRAPAQSGVGGASGQRTSIG